MCMTLESLSLFLSLLSPEIVHASDERVVITAEAQTTVWEHAGDDVWCSDLENAALAVPAEE